MQSLEAAQGQTLISAQLFVHEMPRPLDLPPGLSIQMLLAPSMLLCTCHCARSARACFTSAFKPSGMVLALPARHTLLRRFVGRTDIQRSSLVARDCRAGQDRAGHSKCSNRQTSCRDCAPGQGRAGQGRVDVLGASWKLALLGRDTLYYL